MKTMIKKPFRTIIKDKLQRTIKKMLRSNIKQVFRRRVDTRKELGDAAIRKPQVSKLVARMSSRAARRRNQGLPSIHESIKRTYWQGARPLIRIASEVHISTLPKEVRTPKSRPTPMVPDRLPDGDGFVGLAKEKGVLTKVMDLRMLDGRVIRRIREERVGNDGAKQKLFWTEVEGKRIPFAFQFDPGLPLYQVDLLNKTVKAGSVVIVCEGEPATDALISKGFAAVGTLTGALGTPSYPALLPLRDFRIVLWPDADAVGRRHMERVAKRLRELGLKDVKWVSWEDGPSHGDAADFAGTSKDLAAMVDQALEGKSVTGGVDELGLTGTRFPISPSHLRLAESDNRRPVRLAAPTIREVLNASRALRLKLEDIAARAAAAPLKLEDHIKAKHLQRQADSFLRSDIPPGGASSQMARVAGKSLDAAVRDAEANLAELKMASAKADDAKAERANARKKKADRAKAHREKQAKARMEKTDPAKAEQPKPEEKRRG